MIREEKGKLITSIDELLLQDRVIYNGDKVVPSNWFMSWNLKQTKKALDKKLIYAIKQY